MRHYFVPFACSLAVRVALDEAGIEAEHVLVDAGRLPDGTAFAEVNPLGYVPVLERADGTRLTEAPAILQWIADQAPASGLAPAAGSEERYQVQLWLNLVSSELHKGVFTPLLDRNAGEEVKAYARAKLGSRFDFIARRLEEAEHLAGAFSIADLYLLAVLNWCETCGVDLQRWPAIFAYRDRLRRRPSVMRAFGAERPLLRPS